MAVRETTQIGDPVIRAKAKAVAADAVASPAVRRVVRDLIDSMRAHGLVGMAAPQIGIGARIFVTEIRETRTRRGVGADPVRVFVNPKIVRRSVKRAYDHEGCGSVAHADLFGLVGRADAVEVTAWNEKGKKFTLRARGLLARIIQHENDHLDGIVFLDRMKDLRTLAARESLFGVS